MTAKGRLVSWSWGVDSSPREFPLRRLSSLSQRVAKGRLFAIRETESRGHPVVLISDRIEWLRGAGVVIEVQPETESSFFIAPALASFRFAGSYRAPTCVKAMRPVARFATTLSWNLDDIPAFQIQSDHGAGRIKPGYHSEGLKAMNPTS